MFEKFMFLQLFAEAGTLVNTSVNYVNAYTGDATSFDTAGDGEFGKYTMDAEIKTFYDTELLENARAEMYYAQFGKKQNLPRRHGKTVEWRKFNTFKKATQLQEGVIPTGQKFGVGHITGSIDQYGTYTAISDILEMRAYDDVILEATVEMGASAAETQETLIRDALMTGTNVVYCYNITKATGVEHDQPDVQEEMLYNDTYACILTPKMVNRVATKMKKDRVPKINGKYVAVIHPSCAYDLRESKEWTEVHKYEATTEIFNGEIGELHGVRFVEDTFAPILNGADLASDSRTLKINNAQGYTGAITSVTFDSGTVEADALIGRMVIINGVAVEVTDNTATTLTFDSTDFGTITDNMEIYPGEGAGEGVAAYATFFFGQDAFGTIDPDGGNLEMIIKNKGEIGGPLEQFSTVGYKMETNGATILYPERVVRVMSTSEYSLIDEAN